MLRSKNSLPLYSATVAYLFNRTSLPQIVKRYQNALDEVRAGFAVFLRVHALVQHCPHRNVIRAD